MFLLSGGSPISLVRVIIAVTVNGATEVLMDGVMTNHELSPGTDAGHSTLTVTGKDLSQVMDYIDFSGFPFPGMPNEARVLLILAKYAMFGIVPMVIPSVLIDIPIPTEQIPRQKGKDLAYIKSLADEVGYVFYVDPGPTPGMSIGYWGPEIKVGAPQPALNINMDAFTNVEALNFRFNADSQTVPIVFIQNPQTKVPIPIPIPDITPLNPPLGLIPPMPKNIEPITDTAKYSPIRGAMIGLAKAAKSADGVTANGSLDVLRYGRVLKARKLVGVRGAGVWIEFEQGDVDYPIWSGCWFGSVAEVPALALAAPPAVPNFVIQTQGQNTIMISDLPGPTGGILLKTTTGAMISISDIGITISNGKGAVITMTGPTVDINAGAMTII